MISNGQSTQGQRLYLPLPDPALTHKYHYLIPRQNNGIKQDQERTDTHMHTRSICGERDIEWWEKRKIKDTTRNISS